ncbi:phospholipid/cholesterol/gamma-HCH transport system substrate-binding protein [Chitinophaga niastensis]|uniref:Phospholipid/cholesterol/gamma-HCH transport system substrate-binding protein n=1 Tax=Chitinophaga niastensis TaxID=536980 RepID=A0A2P8HQ91_CHINA|nr:MlaD family protein [Chitinophaga niastensis]PSL48377.1 phospholipid/cholesterol/gamma-HCH transport system substrate-binding protein [Chitinophaga niastensis]
MIATGKKRAVIVGIFVFVGLVIFVTAIMMLGKQQKLFNRSVQVKAIFKDVNGLSAGRNILYSGVKIGTVKKISFVKTNEILVLMNIDKSAQQYLHKDVIARISSDGLMGNKIVMLSGGTPGMPVIEEDDQLAVGSGLSTEEIMNTLQVNNKSLVEITDNLKVITKKMVDGQGTMGKLLTEDTIYNNLNTAMAGLRTTVNNTQRLTGALSAYTAKLQTKGALSNDLVTDTLVFSNLRSTITQMNEVTQHANQVVLDLQHASSGINENLHNPKAPAGMLLQDEDFAESLKQTIKNLEASTGKLDENMEALKHNFLFRGYFRRKAKQEKIEQEEKTKQVKQQK